MLKIRKKFVVILFKTIKEIYKINSIDDFIELLNEKFKDEDILFQTRSINVENIIKKIKGGFSK